MFGKIDAEHGIVIRDQCAIMHIAFGVQPVCATRLFQKLDQPLFKHTCPDPSQHMFLCLALQHDAVDAAQMQQLRQ